MSCKLLETLPEDDAQPVPWLRGAAANRAAPASAAAPRRLPGNTLAGEVMLLRTQLEEFKVSAEQQIRAAFEKGLQQGDAAARQRLENEHHAAVERLAAAVAEVSGSRVETLRRAESDTVRLAVEIARRVLHREISVDPNALEGLVKAALDKLKDNEILRVRANPGLVQLLTESIGRTGRGQSIEILADPSRPPGGIVFEISRGSLDASLDAQLREIERGLADALKTRS